MRFNKYTASIIFIFLCFLIYSNVLHGSFIFDDEIYIVDNYKIQSVSNFFKDFSGTRYVGLLSFALNYYFGGLNTFGYHLVNIIIHIINTILVYFLAVLTFKVLQTPNSQLRTPNPLAFSVSLIFLVHPIQTQAVSYITQRLTSLAVLFYLLSLVLYVKARKAGNGQVAIGNSNPSPIAYSPVPIAYYILSILSAILAMKTKEISFTLPFIIALYEFTFFRGHGQRTRLFHLLPFFLTLSIIPLELFLSADTDAFKAGTDVGKMITELQIMDIENVPVYSYFLTQFRVILTYIRLLFLPINQTFEYDYPFSKSIFEPATFISGIFLLSILVFAAYLYIRSRRAVNGHGLLISFGILWFFITLSVESSIIPIKDVIFEHRLYLPSVGFILSLTTALFYGFDYLEKKTRKPFYNYLLHIVIAAAVLLSFSTYKRNILWNDSYLMWLDTVNKAPNKPKVHYNLGLVYYAKGRLDDAIQEYQTAIRLKPDHELSYNNLGLVYYAKGRLDDAIQEYQTAIRLKPDYILAYNNLGLAYSAKGRFDEAIQEYRTAIRLKPDYTLATNNLGSVYYAQGRLDDAMQEYQTAIRLKPDYVSAHHNLGLVYYTQGRLDDAIQEYQTAIRLKPDYADAHYNLGLVYYAKGWLDDAIQEYQTAIRLKPDYILAYNNLGLAYYAKGKFDEAIQEYRTAIRLKPDYILAYNNLGLVYYAQGRFDEAIQEYRTAIRLKPGYADSHYNLGLAYKIKGLKYESRNEFETVLNLRPDDADARDAIRAIGK